MKNVGLKTLLLTLCLLTGLSPLRAETAPVKLTWSDTVRIAGENNPDLIAARQALESSRANRKESFNGLMPRLDLANSYVRTRNETSNSDRWTARGTVSMDLFDQSRYADIATSRSQLDSSRADLRSAASNVLLNLRQAFTNLLYAQQFIGVSQSVLEIRRTNANLVSLRYDSGRESKGNRLRAEAELTQAEADLNQAQRNLRSAQIEFRRQLGDETPTPVEASGILDSTFTVAGLPEMDDVVETHPDVEKSKATLEGSRADLKQARSVLWPNVTANYSKLLQGHDYFPDEPNWTAGGTLSLPIFGNGPTSAYYSSRAAERAYAQAEENLRSTRYQVRSSLEGSWSNFAGAAEQVDVQKAFLEAARQRNEEADIRYSNGLMSYDDWERIVTDRVNFEQSMIRTERDAMVAEAQWNQARGIELGAIQ